MRDKFYFPQINADVFKNTARKIFIGLMPDDEPDIFASRNFPDHFVAEKLRSTTLSFGCSPEL